MAGKTLAEKLLLEKSGADARAGDYVKANVDVAMVHDIIGPSAFQTFDEMTGDDGELFTSDRTVFAIDHHAPVDGVQAANSHNAVREFVAKHGAHQFDMGDGICHTVLVEEGFVGPGDLVIDADSHSTTYGGIGTFGTGVGSTDLGTVLVTDELWFRAPKTLRFEVDGDLGDGVYAKDLILWFIGDVGFDGCTYMAAEYARSTIESLPIHERLILSSIAVEMGGKVGLVAPDECTESCLGCQTGNEIDLGDAFVSDSDADYEAVHSYDTAALAPQVSKPSNSEDAVDVTEVAGTEIDQLLIGTCMSGRYENIKIIVDILKGETIAPNTRLVVVPASKSVYQHMLQTGVFQTLTDAGTVIQSVGCGPCAGYHQGVLGDDDACLVTANRNFPGREGSMESSVCLSSPATAGVSALYGEITDSREVETKCYDDTVFAEMLPWRTRSPATVAVQTPSNPVTRGSSATTSTPTR